MKAELASQPRLLLLETSGRVGQVAVARGDALLAVRRLDEARRHARDLAPAVAELLAEQGWKARDLNAVVVSRGPGSYTGLRVGLTSAKTLAYATGCRLVAIDTFAAIACQAPAEVLKVAVLADAQQGKVYAQCFTRPALGVVPAAVSDLTVQPLPDWLAGLAEGVWLTGPAVTIMEDKLAGRQLIAESLREPQASSLLSLGLERYRRGETDSLWTLDPLYLRPTSAEEKWQERHGK